jgi:hypothetical protein
VNPIIPSNHLEGCLSLDLIQTSPVPPQAPCHEVRRFLNPPVGQPSAIGAEGHAA